MFGKRLKKLRLERNLLQKELARVLGVSNGAIGMWENGKRTPDYELLQNISEYFNVSLDYLIGKSNVRNPNTTYNLTDKEKELLEKIKNDPEIYILFQDLQNASKQEIKKLIKTWNFLKEELDNMEEDD
ncbi:MAG: helix-turn-helix domain-containing protein [Firmicutes bacterium]|nr:helix-turn-helix domain-containing protein [Bacillota bacterium]